MAARPHPPREDAVALISGGARGLGAAFADALLERGWRVAVFSRRSSEFTERAATTWPDRFLAATIDIQDTAACESFVQQIESTWDGIDLLVNNAGISRPAPIALAGDAYIDSHVNVNLTSALKLTRSVVQGMLRRRTGRIINITSVVGIRGYSAMVPYSAAKAGMDAITRSLAKELGPAGITVNGLAPGYLPTEMTATMPEDIVAWNRENTPLGRLATLDDMIGPFLFLSGPDAGFINGHTLVVDGGLIL